MKTCLIRDIEWENYFLKMIILYFYCKEMRG